MLYIVSQVAGDIQSTVEPRYGRPVAIIFCTCGIYLHSFFFFSLPNFSGHRLDVYHTSTHGVALGAHLECRSEMCCMWLAGNAGCKKSPKIRRMHRHTTLLGCVFATDAHIDNRKNSLNNSIFLTCSHNMVNFGPLAAEIGLPVWGTPANFNGFRVLASLLHRRRLTEVNQTVHDVSLSSGLVHYIYIFRASCP